MKKLLMSLVVATVLSSAAFAGTGTKAPKVNAANKVAQAKASLKTMEEVKETKQGANTNCKYTLRVVSEGETVTTHTAYYTITETSPIRSCADFARMVRRYYSLAYNGVY